MPKKNNNCLAGMRCPKCGHTEPFLIRCRSWHLFYDDGTEDDATFDEEIEYDNDDTVICSERHGGCGHRATLREFNEVNQTKENSND